MCLIIHFRGGFLGFLGLGLYIHRSVGDVSCGWCTSYSGISTSDIWSCHHLHFHCSCLHVMCLTLLVYLWPLLCFQQALLYCWHPLLCFPCLILYLYYWQQCHLYCVHYFCFFSGSHSCYLVYIIIIHGLLFIIFWRVFGIIGAVLVGCVGTGFVFIGWAIFLVIVTVFIGCVVTIIIIVVVIHSYGDVMCIDIFVVDL